MATPLSAMAAAPQSPEPAGSRLSALAPPQGVDQPVNPITQDYYGRLMNDYFGLVSQYQQLPGTDQGRILNTDEARELSPAYREDRTKSADVHEPSSAFVKRLYADKLAAPTPKGQEPTVILTAGGTGAGKTTGMNIVKKINPKAGKAEIIYDTNMNKFESADKKIQQALKAGRKVNIIYTHRDPVEALVNGALKRASRMEADPKLGTGRTVPLSEHAKTHLGARQVVEQLSAKYGKNRKVDIQVIDNSRGEGKAVLSTVDKLPKLDENQVRKGLKDALERARKSGAISEAIYRGTADYAK